MSIWFMLFKCGGDSMILHVCLKCLLQGMYMLMKQERMQNTGGYLLGIWLTNSLFNLYTARLRIPSSNQTFQSSYY